MDRSDTTVRQVRRPLLLAGEARAVSVPGPCVWDWTLYASEVNSAGHPPRILAQHSGTLTPGTPRGALLRAVRAAVAAVPTGSALSVTVNHKALAEHLTRTLAQGTSPRPGASQDDSLAGQLCSELRARNLEVTFSAQPDPATAARSQRRVLAARTLQGLNGGVLHTKTPNPPHRLSTPQTGGPRDRHGRPQR